MMRLAVFASGSGTNFQAIIDAVQSGDLEAEIVLCLTNTKKAGALERASRASIPTAVLRRGRFDSESDYVDGMLEALHDAGANFIALAGYLKMVPSRVVRRFKGRILNIHPALLPSFGGHGYYGSRVHEAVLEYGVRWTGVTIHLVDEEYDTGPVVLQEPVPVQPDDTTESLAARVLKVEHRLYPEALQLFARGRVSVDGRRVLIDQ